MSCSDEDITSASSVTEASLGEGNICRWKLMRWDPALHLKCKRPHNVEENSDNTNFLPFFILSVMLLSGSEREDTWEGQGASSTLQRRTQQNCVFIYSWTARTCTDIPSMSQMQDRETKEPAPKFFETQAMSINLHGPLCHNNYQGWENSHEVSLPLFNVTMNYGAQFFHFFKCHKQNPRRVRRFSMSKLDFHVVR